MRLFTRGVAYAFTVLALAAVVGCESDGSDRDRDDRDIYRRDRAERRRDRDLGRDLPRNRDRDRDRLRGDERVIGRDPVRRDERDRRRGIDEIPAEAVAVEAGDGRSGISYAADRDGTIYVYDVDDDRVIHVGRVMEGERFRLLPEENAATLDGRTVFRSNLDPRHRYRLYFDRRG